MYTSGTTGQPKGAVITNGLAVWNAVVLGERWELLPEDVLLHANPPAFSIFGTTTPVLASGASMILLPKFEAAAVVRALPRATVFSGVPTYYSRLLEHPDFDSRTCAHMRLFVTGSAPMRPDLFEAFSERTGHVLLDRYGLTETLLVTSNPVRGERLPGDSGLPLPGVELRIVDEAGTPVADGETGSIEVRQPFMFEGYWNAPEKTQRAFTQRRVLRHRRFRHARRARARRRARPRYGAHHHRRAQRLSEGGRESDRTRSTTSPSPR